MTLTRVNAIIFDPISSSNTYEEPLTFAVYGITANYDTQTKTATQNNPNSLIQSGDKMAKIEAGVVVPVPGDRLTIMSKVWTVVAVDALNPQGVDLLYTCQVRL